jgi:hypothetical protein
LSTYLESTLQGIDHRLEELRDEMTRLEAARLALSGPGQTRSSTSRGRGRRATRAAATEKPQKATRSRARRARTSPASTRQPGKRARHAMEVIGQKPGITLPQLATAMKVQPNYLYRLLPKLASEGQIRRDGKGWHPAGR